VTGGTGVRYALLTLGMLAAIGVAIGVILIATSSNETLVLDLEVGECFDLELAPGDIELGTVMPIGCDEPHEAEVVARGELASDGSTERPDDDALFALVDARCAAALAERPALLERFGILPVAADERTWDTSDGRYVCVAIPYGGGTTTGSALAADADRGVLPD
jgi:hypothetical protein